MSPKSLSPGSLYALALFAVIGLLVLSDLAPAAELGLEDMDGGPAEITLVVVSCRQCNGGHILNISDGRGGQADAFCPTTAWPSSIVGGTVLKATVSRSSDDPGFFIIQRLEVIEPPNSKD